MFFKKNKLANNFIVYEQIPLNKKTALILLLIPCLLVAIAVIYPKSFLTGVILLAVIVYIFVITLYYCFASASIYIDYFIASVKGKKIIKSGNWWTGNLKYEIEK
jgi:hypothetical protein